MEGRIILRKFRAAKTEQEKADIILQNFDQVINGRGKDWVTLRTTWQAWCSQRYKTLRSKRKPV